MLVTQNMDDYHEQLTRESHILNSKDVHAIHGDALYMHCSDKDQEHSRVLYNSQQLHQIEEKKNYVPLCGVCGKMMRPNVKFFDELYCEPFYRMKTVENFLQECDALIVTGTFSKNEAGRKIIDECIRRKDVPVIEINPETFIRNGYVAQVNMKA